MSTELAKLNENTGLATWEAMKQQASMLVKTGFLPASIKTAEQAVAIMLTGKELGIPPMQALRGVHVIQGTPTIKPELMLALCIERVKGFRYRFGECSDTVATFVCSRPSMSEEYVSTFTLEDAKRAALLTNPTWQKYPANMLRWRAVGNALHIACPDVIVGVYTPDELGAITDEQGEIVGTGEVVTVLEAETVEEEATNPATGAALNRKLHAMATEAFGTSAEGKHAYAELKTGLFGANLRTPDLTDEQAAVLEAKLNELIDKKNADDRDRAVGSDYRTGEDS